MINQTLKTVAIQAEQLRNLQKFLKTQDEINDCPKLDEAVLLYMKNKQVSLEKAFDETISKILKQQ